MKKIIPILSISLLILSGCSGDDAELGNTLDQEIELVIDDGKGEMPESEQVLQIEMETGNYFFSEDEIFASPGQEITIVFSKNTGVHAFALDELGLDESISPGKTITFTAPSEPGEYEYYCSVGQHRALGMMGTLVVTE